MTAPDPKVGEVWRNKRYTETTDRVTAVTPSGVTLLRMTRQGNPEANPTTAPGTTRGMGLRAFKANYEPVR